MARYLMTHSLLSSWLYAIKENPYEDLTSERDKFSEFMLSLNREPIEQTQAMRNGIEFEDLVTAIIQGGADENHVWYNAASKVAGIVNGGLLQYKARKVIEVNNTPIVLYGRLDVLKAGTVYDTKFSKGYEKGKYLSSTQHPTYFELIPEANTFEYIVSNGNEVWTEAYRRDETASIIPIASDFLYWLEVQGLMDVYKEKWLAL